MTPLGRVGGTVPWPTGWAPCRAALEACAAQAAAAAERVRAAEAAEAEAEGALEAGAARLCELGAEVERLREVEEREKLGVQVGAQPSADCGHARACACCVQDEKGEK